MNTESLLICENVTKIYDNLKEFELNIVKYDDIRVERLSLISTIVD